MDGVTILNELLVLSDAFFLIPLAVGILCVIGAIMLCMEDPSCGFLASLLAGAFLSWSVLQYQSDRVVRYEAMVSDSVSLVEITEKYDVVERRGDIWVLEPLEDNDDDEEDI